MVCYKHILSSSPKAQVQRTGITAIKKTGRKRYIEKGKKDQQIKVHKDITNYVCQGLI